MTLKKNPSLVILTTLAFLIYCFKPSFSQDKKAVEPDKYEIHMTELKKKLPSEDFHIVLQKPFVVVGDVPAEQLKNRWSEKTIKWAVDELKDAYFQKDPENILTIWLFKDEDSYNKHNLLLWGSEPTTPFGYYSSQNKVLVMNIATGGGTLVHELVHPYMEANFPNCPPWFNEGMAHFMNNQPPKMAKFGATPTGD